MKVSLFSTPKLSTLESYFNRVTKPPEKKRVEVIQGVAGAIQYFFVV